MADKPPIYRFGRDTPGEQAPNFALWLADRRAKTHAVANRAALYDWIGDTWAENRIAPLMAAIDARSSAPDHSFVAVKSEQTAHTEPGAAVDLWSLGKTQTMTGSHSVTVLVFRTTQHFLLGEDATDA